jgi:hypothetical protein
MFLFGNVAGRRTFLSLQGEIRGRRLNDAQKRSIGTRPTHTLSPRGQLQLRCDAVRRVKDPNFETLWINRIIYYRKLKAAAVL